VTDYLRDGRYPAHRAEKDEAERYVACVLEAIAAGQLTTLLGEVEHYLPAMFPPQELAEAKREGGFERLVAFARLQRTLDEALWELEERSRRLTVLRGRAGGAARPRPGSASLSPGLLIMLRMADRDLNLVVQKLQPGAHPFHVVVDGGTGLSAGEAALIAGAVGAAASIIASLLTLYVQGKRTETRDAAAERRLRAQRITEQLSGLYAPLLLLTGQSQTLARKLREGKPDPEEWHLLRNLDAVIADPADRAITEQIIDINGEIEHRLLNHSGLLKDGLIPDSFWSFLGHYRFVKLAFGAATAAEKAPDAITAKEFAHYPGAFDQDVATSYNALRTELATLSH
jgi:hypothetical protein